MQAQYQAFSDRRQQLSRGLKPGVVIVPTSAEVARNAASTYPYRFDSNFYYLSGFAEPEAVLVLVAGPEARSLLFCRTKDMEREIWDGYRHGPEAARDTTPEDRRARFRIVSQRDDPVPPLSRM